MLLSLVDILRCPAPHEESVLVLSVETWRDQRVWNGTLGCPVCHARYDIRDGMVNFGNRGAGVWRDQRGAPVDASRLAAQLALTEPGGIVLLTGRYADVHPDLIDMAELICLLLDAEPSRAHLAVNIEGVDRLPIAGGSLRGAALDVERADRGTLSAVARCLQPHGRLVAPASTPLPHGARNIASDAIECVAESLGRIATVPLTRRDVFRIDNE